VLILAVLPEQADRRRRVVEIELRHVEVVNKVDELLRAWGPIVLACLLLKLPLHDRLKLG
jgi:hypothetical protein